MAKQTGSIIIGSSFGRKKEELPSIHSSLSPDQRERLSTSLLESRITDPKDLKYRTFFRQVKTALKSSGLFKDVSAVPGEFGTFRVGLKGTGGIVAQGDVGFAIPSSS